MNEHILYCDSCKKTSHEVPIFQKPLRFSYHSDVAYLSHHKARDITANTCSACMLAEMKALMMSMEPDKQDLRPEVKWFAGEMETILKQNDYKGGWKGETTKSLINNMFTNTMRLYQVSDGADFSLRIRLAVNIANYAMMIADKVRAEETGGSIK